MSASAFKSISVVDIGGLYREKAADRQKAADELCRGAREVGFLYITGHRLDPRLMTDLSRKSKAASCACRRKSANPRPSAT